MSRRGRSKAKAKAKAKTAAGAAAIHTLSGMAVLLGAAHCTVPTDAEWLPPTEKAPFAVVASGLPLDPSAGSDVRQPLNPTIQIRFSDFPDPATVTFPTLRMGPRGQSIQFSYELSLVDKQLTLTPRSHLIPETDYFVNVDSGLRSLAGQSLDPPFELRFHTGSDLQAATAPAPPVALATLVADGAPLRQSCAVGGCHSSNGASGGEPVRGLDFGATPQLLRQQLLGAPRAGVDQELIVEAGRPETSYLLRKLLARTSGGYLRIEGEPMPPPGASAQALDLATVRTIESWIRSGAN